MKLIIQQTEDNVIQMKYVNEQENKNNSWPKTLMNSNPQVPLLIIFDTNLELNRADQYFIIGQDNITIDGQGFNVIIKDVIADSNNNGYL